MDSIYHSEFFDSRNPNTDAFIKNLIPLEVSGGMSELFKVNILGKWHILKRVKDIHKKDLRYSQALLREFDIGYHLDHQGIVNYITKGGPPDDPYILTEFVDGKTIAGILSSNHRFSSKEIKKMVLQLLDIFEYLHARQIVHFDIKPENILITTKGGNVKLIDFGLSFSDSFFPEKAGTFPFSSPENVESPEIADGRTDLYALGKLLRHIFLTRQISIFPQIPIHYQLFIKKCMKKNMSHRFASAQKARVAFKRIFIYKKMVLVSLFIPFFYLSFSMVKNSGKNKPSNAFIAGEAGLNDTTASVSLRSHNLVDEENTSILPFQARRDRKETIYIVEKTVENKIVVAYEPTPGTFDTTVVDDIIKKLYSCFEENSKKLSGADFASLEAINNECKIQAEEQFKTYCDRLDPLSQGYTDATSYFLTNITEYSMKIYEEIPKIIKKQGE